jgi:hypothetical protein
MKFCEKKKPCPLTCFSAFSLVLSIIMLIFFCTCISDAYAKPPKSKFYDFSDQVIDGEIKKPTALYTNSRNKVEFDRLLKLKKSFLPDLMETSKEKVFK